MERNTGVKMSGEERKLLVDLGGLKGAPAASVSKPLVIEVPASGGSVLSCYYSEATAAYDNCVVGQKATPK
jgi:hypothetical protein